ncbi:MAG: DUF420 domain-containing protein [Thermoplasmata archaeon]|nr:DUF420 domain-containing protein [Thermoplasmata archaeon]
MVPEVGRPPSHAEDSGFRLPQTVGDHPGRWAALISGVIYLTLGLLLLVPRGAPPASDLGPSLSILTAAANAFTFLFLTFGWLAIRRGNQVRHRRLMELAFVAVVTFLALYVARQVLAGTLSFGGPPALYTAVYLPLLSVHLAISTATVPLVIYNVLVGLSRPLSRVGQTPHPRVGRVIVPLWMASSLMGLSVFALLRAFPAA